MIWQHKEDHTIRYVTDVIKYEDGSYIYYIEGLGVMDPDFWESNYEQARTGEGQYGTEERSSSLDRHESGATDPPPEYE